MPRFKACDCILRYEPGDLCGWAENVAVTFWNDLWLPNSQIVVARRAVACRASKISWRLSCTLRQKSDGA